MTWQPFSESTLGDDRALGMGEIVDAIGDAVGRHIDYEDVQADEYIEARVKEGWPPHFAAFAASWFEAIAAGQFAEVTGDLALLIGRPPQTARQFFRSA
jgi:NAD(P)H dehydrogenase (quinone)